MTTVFRCDDKERLIGYLYGDEDNAGRAAIENHLTACDACATEIAALRQVRDDLVTWAAPEVTLDYRLAREAVARPRAWWRDVPVWAQAMAAMLVLAAGAALANLEVRYGADGLTVRTGWSRSSEPATAANAQPSVTTALPVVERAPAAAPTMTDVAWRAELTSLERRLNAELNTRIAERTPKSAPAPGTDVDRAQLLDQVRSLIDESERRQERELALRLAQVMRDVDTQRRADLVNIQRGFGQLEGQSDQTAARQRELLNYLVRVSQRQ
jgi:hypothetical protein